MIRTLLLLSLLLAVSPAVYPQAGEAGIGTRPGTATPTDANLAVPLASILIDASDVEFFNKVARPTDVIAAKPDTLGLLAKVTAGRKMIFCGPSHESAPDGRWQAMGDDAIRSLMERARQHGAALLGYNLENGSKGEPLVARERHVQELARAAGLTHVFGPLVVRVMGPDAEAIAREADVVVVQAQFFQRTAGFDAQRILGIVRRLRAANPRLQVHVQLSFLNRDTLEMLTPDDVIAHLKLIAGEIDGIWLFYGPRMVDLFRETVTRLRPPRPESAAGTRAETPQALPGATTPGGLLDAEGLQAFPGGPTAQPMPGTQALPGGGATQVASAGQAPPGLLGGQAAGPMPAVPTLKMLQSAHFTTGSWVPFAMLGGQTAGDASPHLARVLGEAGATEAQRREIQTAYREGANGSAWPAMARVFSPEQLARIGRRAPHAAPINHRLVFGVEAQTLKRHPDAADRIEEMVDQVNAHLAAGGVMRRFSVAEVRTYDKTTFTGCVQPRNSGGLSLPADYEKHPLDTILVALDEGAGGANWPCPWISSIEVHGSREQPGRGEKEMFTERSALILCHELGHMLGLPDFYALRLAAEQNPVNHQAVPSEAYDPFGGSLMDDLGPVHPWDAETINREATNFPVINHSWIDYQPAATVLRVLGADGAPLAGAQLRVFRSSRTNYYRQALDPTPTWAGTTDAQGRLSLGPLVLGADAFHALRFFLVEIRQGERTEYCWFSFIEVNQAFWRQQDVVLRPSDSR